MRPEIGNAAQIEILRKAGVYEEKPTDKKYLAKVTLKVKVVKMEVNDDIEIVNLEIDESVCGELDEKELIDMAVENYAKKHAGEWDGGYFEPDYVSCDETYLHLIDSKVEINTNGTNEQTMSIFDKLGMEE